MNNCKTKQKSVLCELCRAIVFMPMSEQLTFDQTPTDQKKTSWVVQTDAVWSCEGRCCRDHRRTPQVMMCGGCRSCLCLSAAVFTKLNKISNNPSCRWNHQVFVGFFWCLLGLSARGGRCVCVCVFWLYGVIWGRAVRGLKITLSLVAKKRKKKILNHQKA